MPFSSRTAVPRPTSTLSESRSNTASVTAAFRGVILARRYHARLPAGTCAFPAFQHIGGQTQAYRHTRCSGLWPPAAHKLLALMQIGIFEPFVGEFRRVVWISPGSVRTFLAHGHLL